MSRVPVSSVTPSNSDCFWAVACPARACSLTTKSTNSVSRRVKEPCRRMIQVHYMSIIRKTKTAFSKKKIFRTEFRPRADFCRPFAASFNSPSVRLLCSTLSPSRIYVVGAVPPQQGACSQTDRHILLTNLEIYFIHLFILFSLSLTRLTRDCAFLAEQKSKFTERLPLRRR